MSTTIDIYPTLAYQPTIGEIRDRVAQLYNQILAPHYVPYEIEVKAYLAGDGEPLPHTTVWVPELDAAFAYCVSGRPAAWSWPSCIEDDRRDEDFAPDDWKDWLDPAILERARAIPYYWSEYRNMGGLAVSSIGYGLVAVAIAERVDGLIATWDSAFSEAMNGSTAESFLPYWVEAELSFYGLEGFRDGSFFRNALEHEAP